MDYTSGSGHPWIHYERLSWRRRKEEGGEREEGGGVRQGGRGGGRGSRSGGRLRRSRKKEEKKIKEILINNLLYHFAKIQRFSGFNSNM